jgi:AcrR family transcriptional regulator
MCRDIENDSLSIEFVKEAMRNFSAFPEVMKIRDFFRLFFVPIRKIVASLLDRSVNQKQGRMETGHLIYNTTIGLIMPRTKEQYEKVRCDKSELIRKTALQLFAEKGYDATSISEIAQSAGISKGLMYNYFDSKEKLLQTIWDDLGMEFENMIDPNHDGHITDEEAEDFIGFLFEHMKTKRSLYKLYYQLSFQPKVVDFLITKYHRNKMLYPQNLIIDYFSKKLPHSDAGTNRFTTLVFLKGLAMVVTYTENYFNNDFLDKYRDSLKAVFFPDKSNDNNK